jgi:hypothetical protein
MVEWKSPFLAIAYRKSKNVVSLSLVINRYTNKKYAFLAIFDPPVSFGNNTIFTAQFLAVPNLTNYALLGYAFLLATPIIVQRAQRSIIHAGSNVR